jgi:hypothetical protein
MYGSYMREGDERLVSSGVTSSLGGLGRTLFRSTTPIAIFLRRSRRSTLVSDAPATPPPPNLEPTRFWKGTLTMRLWCSDVLANLEIYAEK